MRKVLRETGVPEKTQEEASRGARQDRLQHVHQELQHDGRTEPASAKGSLSCQHRHLRAVQQTFC